MKIMVTGNMGYIGTILVPMLVEEGFDVIGYDSDLYRECTFGDGLPDVQTINKDIRDVSHEDLEGVDAVLHLAGLSNDPLGNLNPKLTFEINHQASVRLAQISKEVGVKRFIFSSSCSNYGAAGVDWVNEESAFNPVTPYGESKVKVEQDVCKLASDTFSPIFLRNATAYGVSPRLRFDLVLNNLVAWAFTTGEVHLKSDGTPWRPIVHIEDISRAFVAVLKAPIEKVHNQAFNVGQTEENFQVREIAEIVADAVPGSHVDFADDASPDKRSYRVKCDKIFEVVPEFQPQWTARKGAKELYETYKKIGLTLEEFEGQKYKRIDHIKLLLNSNRLDMNLRWVK